MRKSSILFLFLLLGFMFMPNVVKADNSDIEPNDSKSDASLINVGITYGGKIDDSADDNADFYKIKLKEGDFYKITISTKEEQKEHWGNVHMYLSYDSDTDSDEDIKVGYDTSMSISKLFQPRYTGIHYLEVYCYNGADYSFVVEKFDPFGMKLKDDDANVYMITGNDTVEFSKASSKNVSEYALTHDVDFSYIDGIRLLNKAYFNITTIGEKAFEECNFKNLTLHDNIDYIDSYAFKNCKKLETVWIEGKDVTINNNAFYNCSKLRILGLEKGASLEYVGKNALKGTKTGIKIFTPNKKKYKKIFKKSGAKKPKYKKA